MCCNEPRTRDRPVTKASPLALGQQRGEHPPDAHPSSAAPTPFRLPRRGHSGLCPDAEDAVSPPRLWRLSEARFFREPIMQDESKHVYFCDTAFHSQETVMERPRQAPVRGPCCDTRGIAGARAGPPRREPAPADRGPLPPAGLRSPVSGLRQAPGLSSLPQRLRNLILFPEAGAPGNPGLSTLRWWLIFGFWRPGPRARSGLWFHRAGRPGPGLQPGLALGLLASFRRARGESLLCAGAVRGAEAGDPFWRSRSREGRSS